MEHEIRYYLRQIKQAMDIIEENGDVFIPQYLITATKLPSGSIELIVNTTNIPEKIDYILDAYDDDMHLKSNPEVVMQNIMVV